MRMMEVLDNSLKTIHPDKVKIENNALRAKIVEAYHQSKQREHQRILGRQKVIEERKEYLEKFGGTIEELAKQLSMNRSTISNMLRLLDLPETVQDAVRKEQISGGHARALLALSADAQTEMCQQIQSQQLSVRKTEEAVRALVRGDAPAAAPTKPERPEMTPHVLSLQDGLREHYAARVEIKLKKKDAGQVVIHFDSNDDFERIVGLLRKAG